MWNCVEERERDPIGRIQRKLIFTEIYENEHYAKGKISIPKEIDLQTGKKVAYYEDDKIRTGEFLCSSTKMKLSPAEIITRMINTEDELKHFIKQNQIKPVQGDHLFGLVISAYQYLKGKLDGGFVDNTGSTRSNSEDDMKQVAAFDGEHEVAVSNSISINYAESAHDSSVSSSREEIGEIINRSVGTEVIHRRNNFGGEIETINLQDDEIKIEIGDEIEEVQINDRLSDRLSDTPTNGQQMSFQIGSRAVQLPGSVATSLNLTHNLTNSLSFLQKRPSSLEPTSSTNDKSKRARIEQPTIEVSLDNLAAIGKKEALMLTKDQIEMMLRVQLPEVTLVPHVVRRPDLEKYWTYIRKINVNGHQTVWTQCTNCGGMRPYRSPGAPNGGYLQIIYKHAQKCNEKIRAGLLTPPNHTPRIVELPALK